VPPGPEARYGVHFLSPGPGVTPLLSTLAPTLGSTQTGVLASQSSGTLQQTASPRPLSPKSELLGHHCASLGTRERQSRRAKSTNEMGGPGWRRSSAQLRQRSRPSAFAGSDGCPRASLKARHAQFRHQRQATNPRLPEPRASLRCQGLGSARLGSAMLV
jgi:hypothetical protein